MTGIAWVAAIWSLTIGGWSWLDRRAGRPRRRFNRETIAVIIALLGTKSIAASTSAEEVLRDPAVTERVLRGGLAMAALLIATPVLIQRLRGPRTESGFRNLTFIAAYLLVVSVSVVYSVAPLVTAAKVLELTAGIVPVFAAALASDGSRRVRDMIVVVVALEASLLLTAVIGFFALPGTFAYLDFGAGRVRPGFITQLTMTSPWSHPNYLSAMGGLVATYALAWSMETHDRRRRAGLAVLIALCALGTLLASGRQGVIILLISVSVLLWFRRRALFMLAIGPTAAVVLWLNWDSVFGIFTRGQPDRLSNLSGRLGWWESAVSAWAEHPWTGHGFGAGGRFVALTNIGSGGTSNVHSGYIEALVGVGLLGLIPLGLAVLVVAAWSLRALAEGRDVPFAILIVPMVIHTAVARGFGAWLNGEVVIFVCLVAITDWWRRERIGSVASRHLAGTSFK